MVKGAPSLQGAPGEADAEGQGDTARAGVAAGLRSACAAGTVAAKPEAGSSAAGSAGTWFGYMLFGTRRRVAAAQRVLALRWVYVGAHLWVR